LASVFFGFRLRLRFHAHLFPLNSTWPGPVDKTDSVSPAGSGRYLFQDMPTTIRTIANTGVMLKVGQERSHEKKRPWLPSHVAPQILTAPRRSEAIELFERVSESYNHPEGVAVSPMQ
jgi:hypothetical protein